MVDYSATPENKPEKPSQRREMIRKAVLEKNLSKMLILSGIIVQFDMIGWLNMPLLL